MDSVLALRALAAILADPPMRERFLALTGYDGATLRARAASPEIAEAVAGFLGGHEPDLLRVAAVLEVPPEQLVDWRA